jgi:16S rRNA (uracil1498-N3)-methyltransferase
MRARPGDAVVLFDGSGAEFPARVVETGAKLVRLEVIERRSVVRELPAALILAVALPKGERSGWLVEKSVELGVTRLVPIATRRGVVRPGAGRLEHLRRMVVAASKQCGRNRLMEIAPCIAWEEFAAVSHDAASGNEAIGHGWIRWLGDPDAQQPAWGALPSVAVGQESAHQGFAIAIGPEGGFDSDEMEPAVRAGWQPVNVGPRTLRVETAAVALCALAAAWMQGFVGALSGRKGVGR